MSWVIFIEGTFKITTLFEFVKALAMLLEINQWTLVLISIRVLYNRVTDYFIFIPNSFDLKPLLRIIA